MTRPLIAATVIVAAVVAANAATSTLGLVPAGFGLLVTAGTWAAGITLVARDVLHEVAGATWRQWMLAAIGAGVLASLAFGSWRIAAASAVAFALAEVADLAVYAPLRARARRTAVLASGFVGAVIDSIVFLAIAGFPLTAATVGGQVLVKAGWVALAFLVLAEGVRRVVPRESVHAGGA